MEASIEWSLPPTSERNGVILAYYIYINNPITGNETVVTTNSFSILFEDLEPYTTYQYAVAAYTSVGVGPLSSYYSFRTEEDGETFVAPRGTFTYTFTLVVPSAPPELVSMTEITSNSVKLYWDIPPLSEHNGIIRKYIIKQIEVNTGAVKYFNATDTIYVATALHPYSNYSFSVSAVTVAPGPYSEGIIALTKQDGMSKTTNIKPHSHAFYSTNSYSNGSISASNWF